MSAKIPFSVKEVLYNNLVTWASIEFSKITLIWVLAEFKFDDIECSAPWVHMH